MKTARDRAVEQGKACLNPKTVRRYHRRYDEVIKVALEESPKAQIRKGRRGLVLKRGRELSLVERLREYKDAVCMFLQDFDVPFDNNLAERGFRMVKTKAKVSGFFRSFEGAESYLAVMSYIDTARKHGISMFDAMTAAFDGRADIVLDRVRF